MTVRMPQQYKQTNTGARLVPRPSTIFFGLANFLTDVGGGPPGRNPEWPYVSSEGRERQTLV
jgi:hypothetical protein